MCVAYSLIKYIIYFWILDTSFYIQICRHHLKVNFTPLPFYGGLISSVESPPIEWGRLIRRKVKPRLEDRLSVVCSYSVFHLNESKTWNFECQTPPLTKQEPVWFQGLKCISFRVNSYCESKEKKIPENRDTLILAPTIKYSIAVTSLCSVSATPPGCICSVLWTHRAPALPDTHTTIY